MSRKWLPLGRSGFWLGGNIKETDFWSPDQVYSPEWSSHRCVHAAKIYWAIHIWFMYFSLCCPSIKKFVKKKKKTFSKVHNLSPRGSELPRCLTGKWQLFPWGPPRSSSSLESRQEQRSAWGLPPTVRAMRGLTPKTSVSLSSSSFRHDLIRMRQVAV